MHSSQNKWLLYVITFAMLNYNDVMCSAARKVQNTLLMPLKKRKKEKIIEFHLYKLIPFSQKKQKKCF